MRVSVTLVEPRTDRRADVLLQADDQTPFGEVAAELLSAAQSQAHQEVISLATPREPRWEPTALYHRGERLDTATPLEKTGLHEGSIIAVGDPRASILVEPDGVVELRLVSGRGAGRVHRLTVGEATLGSDPGCVIRLPDDRLPPVAVTVSVQADGRTEVAPYDGATDAMEVAFRHLDYPLALDRESLTGSTEWPDSPCAEGGPRTS